MELAPDLTEASPWRDLSVSLLVSISVKHLIGLESYANFKSNRKGHQKG